MNVRGDECPILQLWVMNVWGDECRGDECLILGRGWWNSKVMNVWIQSVGDECLRWWMSGIWMLDNPLWYWISETMGLKDTKSVISLNFLKGAGLKCPINHCGWRTPESPLTKRFQISRTQFEKSDRWIWSRQSAMWLSTGQDRRQQITDVIDCPHIRYTVHRYLVQHIQLTF